MGWRIVIALVITCFYMSSWGVLPEPIPYPKVNYGTGEQAEQIKQGEYLVKLGDCISCHTRESGEPFAGGREINTPYGAIYSPNITPDKQTGIASWTEQDFFRAMRHGISPKGKYYYPVFPFYYFSLLTEQDLRAIKAYLDAVPAVVHQNIEDDIHFPLSWRFLQLGWRILFFENKRSYKNDSRHSAAWNRGKYLVDGIGHCSMCHTPMHHLIFKHWGLAAPDNKYYLTGAFIDGYYAPNITNALMQHATVKQLKQVFLRNKSLQGESMQGPMAVVDHDSLKYLRPEDIQAIAIYLKSVKSEAPAQTNEHVKDLALGKKIYHQYCMGCHTTGAGGAPKIGDKAVWRPLIQKGLNQLYKNSIEGVGGMPARGTCLTCTNAEVQAAVRYLVNKSRTKLVGTKTIKPKPFKKLTLDEGKNIYEQHCASCHEGQVMGVPQTGDKNTWAPLIAKGVDHLVLNTINGYKGMPSRGGCKQCNDAEIKAAVKYMVQQSALKGDYRLW